MEIQLKNTQSDQEISIYQSWDEWSEATHTEYNG